MTALERATRLLVRRARRWNLARRQDAMTERLCAELLADAIGAQIATELRAVRRATKRRRP